MKKYLSNSHTYTFLAAILLLLTLDTQCKQCSCQKPQEPKQPCEIIMPEESSNEASDKVTAEISIGELIDKITILEIKAANIKDQQKLQNIRIELESLSQTRDNLVPSSDELTALTAQLLEINKKLWDIEDDIRDKERNRCFDKEFIELARSVYYTNDKRCAVKRKINVLAGSRLVEEKSYTAY